MGVSAGVKFYFAWRRGETRQGMAARALMLWLSPTTVIVATSILSRSIDTAARSQSLRGSLYHGALSPNDIAFMPRAPCAW